RRSWVRAKFCDWLGVSAVIEPTAETHARHFVPHLSAGPSRRHSNVIGRPRWSSATAGTGADAAKPTPASNIPPTNDRIMQSPLDSTFPSRPGRPRSLPRHLYSPDERESSLRIPGTRLPVAVCLVQAAHLIRWNT